jgi:ABC-type nickel/cobalt efflux system permease component RcnA
MIALAVTLLALPAMAQQPGPGKNPFGLGSAPAGESARPAVPASSPGLVHRASLWVTQQQAVLHRQLSTSVRRFKSADPFTAALMLAAISFAYGVLHAVGPGHGKAVISSYVLADGRTMRRGVLLSFLAAGIQAISALVLVAILVLVLRSTGMQMRIMEAWLETISWGLVALVGAWLVYYQLRTVFAPAPVHALGTHAHDHHHAHDGYPHDAACEVCAHLPAPSELQGEWSWRRAFAIALAVGIRPCTGAILVLVFAIGQGLWWAGVFSTFAMALGTAITVSALAALAVGSRELAKRLAGTGSSKWADRVQMAAGLGGASLVLCLGALFFWGSLSNVQVF